jgi:hypothetical protein
VESPDAFLSVAEIRRRCAVVVAESVHLKWLLPVDNVHNRILRLEDIARYIGVTRDGLRRATTGDSPFAQSEDMQKNLSRFFKGWDAGHLVKALHDGQWKIVSRYESDPSLAQMAAPARPPIQMGIEVTRAGPHLIVK